MVPESSSGRTLRAQEDSDAWSISKGLLADGPLAAAKREFAEETGYVPRAETVGFGCSAKQNSRWTARYRLGRLRRVESGRAQKQYVRNGMAAAVRKLQAFPNLDRAAWFKSSGARERILRSHTDFLDRLLDALR